MFLNLTQRSVVLAFIITVMNISMSMAQEPYVLHADQQAHRLDKYVHVLIDESESLDHEDILSDSIQKLFDTKPHNLTFGYTKATIWLKLSAINPDSSLTWLLEIPAPFLEYVDFYQQDDQLLWQHFTSGYYRPQSQRVISHTAHLLPLQFGQDGTSHVYIKIAGRSPKTFPVYIHEKESFYEKVRFEDVGYGIFFGILFVMFFYNLFIFITLKQSNYLLYICTIVCTFLIFSSASGYAGKFLWPESPMMNFYAGRMSLGVITIFLAAFTIRFLEVKQYSKGMYYLLVSLFPLSVAAAILTATGLLSSAGNNLISLSTIIYLATGIVCRIKGNRTANFFIAAWSVYLVGGLLLTLRNSGVFPSNFWTTHFVEIGATMETVIIAFALGDRYRRYKEEKEEAQQRALEIQQEANEKLEIKVAKRTVELQHTLDTIQLQKSIIEEKNAELDAFFYRVSHDLKGPMATMLALNNIASEDIKDKEALDYLSKQNGQILHVNQIINGLISLTLLNNDMIEREAIDFNKLIDDCIDTLRSVDGFNRVLLKRDVQADITFESEYTLLNAIFQNLIENAIKYSKNQGAYASISVKSDNKEVVIEVEDNGTGIPDEYQTKIFDMFYRANNQITGTGLGLYILKRSVDKLKGSIQVDSKPGVGSIFTVKLPHH